MGFDIRLPIGGLFTILGIMLSVYGLVSDKALYQRSLGINVNLEWGLVTLAFGIVMVVLGRRSLAKDLGTAESGGEARRPHGH
jgi:hypothetical protein